jgi:hypothetical protein
LRFGLGGISEQIVSRAVEAALDSRLARLQIFSLLPSGQMTSSRTEHKRSSLLLCECSFSSLSMPEESSVDLEVQYHFHFQLNLLSFLLLPLPIFLFYFTSLILTLLQRSPYPFIPISPPLKHQIKTNRQQPPWPTGCKMTLLPLEIIDENQLLTLTGTWPSRANALKASQSSCLKSPSERTNFPRAYRHSLSKR